MPGQFNPANGQVSVGFEPVEGIDPTSWHDHTFTSEGLSNEAETIALEDIVALSQAEPGLPSKIGVNGPIEFSLDAEGQLAYFVNAQGANSSTIPDTGVNLHRLAPSETTPNTKTLANRVWRDDNLRQTFNGGRVSTLTVNLEPRGTLKTTVEMLYARSRYFSGPTEEVDTGVSIAGPASIRGLYNYDNWLLQDTAAADGRLHVKVTSIAGSPTSFTATAKVGGGAYGSDTFEVTVGLDSAGLPIWTSVIDGAGSQVGTRALPVEFWINAITGIEVGDTWSFDAQDGVWTPDYPDVPKFNEIFAFIYFGDYGEEEAFCVRQLQMTLTRPLIPVECIGGRFAKEVRERGQREVIYSFEREYLDINLRRRLETGEPFSIRVEAYSGEEFETGYEHQFFMVSPNCISRGRTPSINSRDDMPESVEAQAYPDAANADSFFDDITFLFQNSIANPNT